MNPNPPFRQFQWALGSHEQTQSTVPFSTGSRDQVSSDRPSTIPVLDSTHRQQPSGTVAYPGPATISGQATQYGSDPTGMAAVPPYACPEVHNDGPEVIPQVQEQIRAGQWWVCRVPSISIQKDDKNHNIMLLPHYLMLLPTQTSNFLPQST
ncbi:hypothetical protein C8T65DRAFT_745572 [Cerioporus squamosus]|nr:hypothetical protein C8T65DRAFT_745572 [Cerioporus squamosus]